MSEHNEKKYPLLEALLAIQGEPLKSMYSNKDVANLFDVSVRSIQEWSARGPLVARDLPGRWRFFPQDLETFLKNSGRKPTQ